MTESSDSNMRVPEVNNDSDSGLPKTGWPIT